MKCFHIPTVLFVTLYAFILYIISQVISIVFSIIKLWLSELYGFCLSALSKPVLPKPVLEDTLPCTFCLSPLSNTPDSTHQLVSRDCKN